MGQKGKTFIKISIFVAAFVYFLYVLPCFFEHSKTIKVPKIVKIFDIVKITKKEDPVVPDDIRINWDYIENKNFDEYKERVKKVQKDIDEIKEKIDGVDYDESKSVIEDPHKKITEKLIPNIQTETVEGEKIPLVLKSIFDKEKKVGKSVLHDVLNKIMHFHHYDDGIEQDKTKRWCASSQPANFTFWAPYGEYVSYIYVNVPAGLKNNAATMHIQLLFEEKVVAQKSPTFIKDNRFVFYLEEPTRFSKLKVIARSGKSTVCIGDVEAFTSKKLKE